MLTNVACSISRAWDCTTVLRLHQDRLGLMAQKAKKDASEDIK